MSTARRSGPYRTTTLRTVSLASRRIAAALAAVMAVTVAGQAPAVNAAPAWTPPKAPEVTGVAVKPLDHKTRPSWTAADRQRRGNPTVTWPVPGRTTVDLTDAVAGASRGSGAKAGNLPVWVAPPPVREGENRPGAGSVPVRQVTVEVLDQQSATDLGVPGVLLRINRADGVSGRGTVTLHVDYSGFARAYGADWAARLRLVRLPDRQPLRSANDRRAAVVSAPVDLPADGTAVTLAVTSGPSGDSGDFTATSLSPTSTWQVGQQTGDFTWSYPFNAPPGVGGPEPSVALTYSSGSVDGRTAGTNTQGSWIGDGWDFWPGYIERQYTACNDDKEQMRGGTANNTTVNSGDLCWLKPDGNATISLNGRATELVKATGNTWKGVSDDGAKIELLVNTSFGNGDGDGEYWKVTTLDGTQYFFGRNSGPGGASGAVATNSVWTVPVYGNHPDEPGHTVGNFAGSRTTQGWRWNLDHVVDLHGNTLTYFYSRETGAYGREGDPTKRTTYHRGGWLTRAEYGNRSDAASTTQPAARLLFDEADRCESACWSGSNAVPASWPDTPWDQYCTASPCTNQLSPTFWTAKRLARVRAQVYSGTGTTYQDVTWWTLRHTYLQTGDNTGEPMWLAGVTRTGKVTSAGGTEVTDPEIVFDPGSEARPNRVDASADGRSDLFRYRINTVTTETGAQVAVTYSAPECTRSTLPQPHANTKACFPRYWAPDGGESELDWFHKYRVTRIDVYDNTGGFVHEQNNYDYLDTPAWHHDDSELVEEKERTWSQYRGYGHVRVRKGLESGVQSASEYRYFRGMDGDKQPTGTRTVTVTDSQNVAIADHEAYAGMLREETALLGVGGAWVSGTIHTPLRQGPTATFGPLKAWMTNVGTTRSRSRLASGSTRWVKTVTTFNSDNLPTQVDDLGDEATADDDRCTRTWYARNPSNHLLGRVKRAETVGVNCAATASLPGDMISSTRITYDQPTNDWNTYLPVKGDVVRTEEIASWSGTTPTWLTTARAVYDGNGRGVEAYDALDRKTTTTYTPPTAGPVTAKTVTNALGHSATATYATAWQLPVTTTDSNNGGQSEATYDGLGRLLKVWRPGRAKATYPNSPDVEHSYLVRNTAPTAVTTQTMTPSVTYARRTSITLYDGLLRPRQTQTQATGGGRFLTDTVHDSRGLVQWTSQPYYDTTNAPPATELQGQTGTPAVPAHTLNLYDGAARIIAAVFKVGVNEATNEKWRTTTSYNGERVSVTPPQGGTATTTISDARGHTVELRQYKNRADVGSDNPAHFDKTTYGYAALGELDILTDPAGNTWRYTYDQLGRRIRDEDPDRGVTVSTYDAAGQLTTVTDARNRTLAYTYDQLGRKTSLRNGSTTGPKRAEWIYDTLANGAGRLSSAIRYEPAGSTNAYRTDITGYDVAGRPLGSQLTLPAVDNALCAAGGSTPCTYTYATTYRPDGAVATTTLPAAGGLASEKLTYGYTDVGAPMLMLAGGLQGYVNNTVYDKLGNVSQRVLGATGKRTWITYTTDQHTGRLLNANAIPELKPEVFNFEYSYDHQGNLTRIADTPAGGTADTQCFEYDYLRRLTAGWTPGTGDCAPAPSVAGSVGPGRYWHSYTYDAIGNRRTETDHLAGTLRTYTYPASGGAAGTRPHAVSSVATTGAITKTDTYTYTDTGDTATRPGSQTLTWSPEGQLDHLADPTGTTSYVYDADGNRLIRRDPTGSTLYLPDGTEVRKPTASAAAGTRYYSHAGAVVAMRTLTALTWLVNDHHNTAEVTIANTDLSATRRRTLPFGNERGTPTGAWPAVMDKGFLGGTKDNTGLVHLGAREYDPALGRFISVDPLQNLGDPQQWNGYAYGNNSPATFSDPSGLIFFEDAHGGGQTAHPKSGAGGGKNTGSGFQVSGKPQNQYSGGIQLGGTPDGKTTKGDDAETLDEIALLSYKRYYDDLDPVEQRAVQWGAFCYNSPDICSQLDAEKEKQFRQVLGAIVLEITGAADGIDCAGGSALGCTFLAAGLLVPRVGKIKSLGRVGAIVLDAGRGTDDVPWGGLCSFSGDTKVLMADGTAKPISDVRLGDKVLATNPETGEQGPRLVTHLWVHEDTLLTLVVNGKAVKTTADHPFWNASEQQWQRADALKPGARLYTPSGAGSPVAGLSSAGTAASIAYNLTVADVHTYYVLAGNTSVLVHNTCGPEIDVNDLKLSDTVAAHTRDTTRKGTPARPFNESRLTMQEIMRGSTPRPDPGGVPGGLRWDTPGALNGKQGTWELVVDTRTNTVLHYNFVTG